MNQQNLYNQALALSAMAQAALIVDEISRTGNFSDQAMDTLVYSLFQFNPVNTRDVYNGAEGLALGKKHLQQLLNLPSNKTYQSTMRYMSGLIALAKQLQKRNDLSEVIHSRLQHVEYNVSQFSASNTSKFSSIAGIYSDTLSTLPYRINVTGDAKILQTPANADKIRTALLAGVRSALLWRQCGGKRWQLILSRNKLVKQLDSL